MKPYVIDEMLENSDVNLTSEVVYSNDDIQWVVAYDTKLHVYSTNEVDVLADFVNPFNQGLGIAVQLSTGQDESISFLEFYLQQK